MGAPSGAGAWGEGEKQPPCCLKSGFIAVDGAPDPKPCTGGQQQQGARAAAPLAEHQPQFRLAFRLASQGHWVQPPYLSKLAKQPGWKLA